MSLHGFYRAADESEMGMARSLQKRDRYPESDWRYEVANGDTLLGYEEWLDHRDEDEG